MTITLKDIATDAARQAETWHSDPTIADIYQKIAIIAEIADVLTATADVPPAPPPSPKKKGKKR